MSKKRNFELFCAIALLLCGGYPSGVSAQKKGRKVKKEIKKMFADKKIVLRIQSECFLGMYGDSHCDCESQRIDAIKLISQEGGIFVHLPQEAQGWGLHYKLKELELQVSGRTQNGEYVGKKDRDSAQKMLLDIHNFRDNRSYEIVAEILPGLTVMEALNTDLVCDAINTAMRELFLQIVYGRTQSAFSEGGLAVGAGLEDLGKGLRSQVGTMYGTLKKGPRYLEMAEGYVTGIALDKDNQIIGYKFVSLGKMTDFIKKGDDPTTAYEKACGQYGRVADAVKIIDPRTDEEVK